MAEGVPAKVRDADLLAFGPENLPLNHPRIVATTRNVRRKDKPARPASFTAVQDLRKSWIKRDFIVGRFGFDSPYAPVDDSLLNQHRSGLVVDMLPATTLHI